MGVVCSPDVAYLTVQGETPMKYVQAVVLAALAFLAASPLFAQTDSEHVFYEDSSQNVQEVFYNSGWNNYNLTSLSGAASAATGSPLTSYEYYSSSCTCDVDAVNF